MWHIDVRFTGVDKKKSPSKLGGSRGIRDKEIIAWRQISKNGAAAVY